MSYSSAVDYAALAEDLKDALEIFNPIADNLEISLKSFGKARDSLQQAKENYSKDPTTHAKEELDDFTSEAKLNLDIVKNLERDFSSKLKIVALNKGVSRQSIIKSLEINHNQVENDRMLNILKAAQTLDICFVIDATGSMHMDKMFEALRKKIRDILDSLKENNPYLKYQLSFVAYRDPEDGPKHIELLPFTSSKTEFEDRIKKINAAGGGDECEDVIGGLDAAANFRWLFANRLLFLCGDAPCHGMEYHRESCEDRHPSGLGINSCDVIRRFAELNVLMFFWKINDTTNKMIDKFNEEARSMNLTADLHDGTDEFIKTIPIDIKSIESIIQSMAESITSSVSSSLSKSMSKGGGIKPRSIKNTLRVMEKLVEEEDTRSDLKNPSVDRSMKAIGGGFI
eukprot:gene10478-14081_t